NERPDKVIENARWTTCGRAGVSTAGGGGSGVVLGSYTPGRRENPVAARPLDMRKVSDLPSRLAK
ncbi:MAG: hypothetical protein ABR557_14530, partial [Pyrinomonadaceae bacterium]